jgi:hypothetical protein
MLIENETWDKERMKKIYSDVVEADKDSYQAIDVAANKGSKPLHQNSIVKALLVFTMASAVGGVIWLVFSSGKKTSQMANLPTEKAPEIAQEDKGGWKIAAEQGTANGMGVDVDDANSADKKPDVAKLETADKPKADAAKTPATKAPVAQPSPSIAPVPKPMATPPVVQQAPKSVSATPVVYSQPRATQASLTKNNDAKIKSLETKIDKLTVAIAKQNTQQKELKAIDKPTTIAAASTKPATEASKPPVVNASMSQPQVQHVAQTNSPAIDGKAMAKLFDPVTISSSGNNSSSAAQSLVRIQLTQPIPTSNGLEIPAGSIVAMNIAVASNGMVSGSSTGVWDVRTQKQLNIPAGALVVEGVKGQILLAQSIKPNDGDAQAADTQAAIWQAAGAGVDGVTRPDSNSSITAGTIVTTATSGGSRDLLTNAAGGFAKSKASSIEKDAAKRRDKISAQAELWHLPQNTEVVVSVRPPVMATEPRYSPPTGNQYQQYQPSSFPQSQPSNYQQYPQAPQYQPYQPNNYQQYPQYQQPTYQTEAPPLVPARYAVNPVQR